jgi:hypothetical protein
MRAAHFHEPPDRMGGGQDVPPDLAASGVLHSGGEA